jgi:hypothetical protein
MSPWDGIHLAFMWPPVYFHCVETIAYERHGTARRHVVSALIPGVQLDVDYLMKEARSMRNPWAIGTLALLATAGVGSAVVTAQAVEKEAMASPNAFYAGIVASNGNLIDNVGVAGVSKTDVGRYTVTFKKDVSSCFATVSIYGGTSGAIRWQRDTDPKGIDVSTRSEGTASVNPDFADRQFSIVVICK